MFTDGLRHGLLKKSQDKEREEERQKKEKLGVAEATGGLISDKEWYAFQNKNQVSDRILEGIGARVAEGKRISPFEIAIYDRNVEAVEEAGRRREKEMLEDKKDQIKNFQLAAAQIENVPEDKKEKAGEASREAEDKLAGAKSSSISKLDEAASRLENGKVIFRAGVVDTGDIAAARARRSAHEQMTADKEELKGIGGFFKKIWKYNYAEQATHEKKRVQAKEKIVTEGNIYANENLSPEERAAAGRKFNEVTVGRFIAEANDLIETGLGEKRQEFGGASPEEQKIKADLRKIIDDYADGKLDESGFEGAKREIFKAIEKADSQETLRKGEMYVDNFLVIAQRVRELKNQMAQVAGHQAGLDRLDYDIELIVGRAKEGIKTEANYNIAEKTVERLRSTKLGSLVNETTLAVGVGAAYAAIEGVGKIIGSRTAAAITFGLSAGVSGVFAAVKESQMQKRERETLESREAVGAGQVRERLQSVREDIKKLETSLDSADKKDAKRLKKELKDKRAEEKKLAAQEGYLYERRLANDLRQDLEQATKGADPDRLVACLAEVEARMNISDERKIDLIGYTDTVAVEEERLALLQAKAAARQKIAELQAADQRDLDSLIKAAVSVQKDQLLETEGGVLDRDKLFRKYRNSAVAKKLVQHVGVGLAVGLVAQEAIAFATDKQEGLVENLIKGNDRPLGSHDTVLEAVRNAIGGQTAEQLQSVGVMNGTIKLPASCEWLSDGHGSYSIRRGADVIADGLHFRPDGSLTEEAKSILAERGLAVSDSQNLIDQGVSTATVTRGPQEYIDKHPGSFSKVSRQLWYDNDTPMYKGEDGKWHGADFNERRLDWGGDNGSGINMKTGSYEMSVFRMTADGSFHTSGGAKLSDDAVQLIKEGKMKVLFSLSADTQNQVIELPVDPTTGKVSVPRDSDMGRLLFGENKGQAVLKARFAEAAFVSGETESGVQKVRLFATAVGEGLKETTDTVTTANPPLVTTITDIGVPRTWIMPPFIPVGARTPLEKIKQAAAVKPEEELVLAGVPAAETPASSYYDRYYGGPQKEDYVDLNRYRAGGGNAALLAQRAGYSSYYSSIKGTTLEDYRSDDNSKLNITLDKSEAEDAAKAKRHGLRITLDRDNYDPDNSAKNDVADLQNYKDGGDKEAGSRQAEKLKKYGYIFENLRELENYDDQDEDVKARIEKERNNFNRNRHAGAPLSTDEYVGQQITRLHHQIDNILMSEAKVGDKPFNPDFYEKAPLVKGLEQAQEIVIILDSPIGDAVMTIPALIAVQKYLALNKMSKPIKLVASPLGMDLFRCVKDQFPQDVELVNYEEMGKVFAKDKKEKFVINAHKNFKDYGLLNLGEGDNKDLTKVMSVAWDSWTKEEIPKRKGVTEKYDPIPARIMRNFENMLGQKLFDNINKMDHYLEKGDEADKVIAALKKKYGIGPDEQVVVISAGSSVQPKEYEPEKWQAVISDTLAKYPKAHVLFLQDPQKERWSRYSQMAKGFESGQAGRFHVVNEPTNRLNGLMSMADVVVTPDTGLGHYASALGKPNVMLILGDPVRWSNATTDRIMHRKATQTYAKNAGTYSAAWGRSEGYYVNDNGEMIGSSNIDPAIVMKAIERHLAK